jgi:hypothetical protein
MRGYSIISDEERAQILNTHRSFYDGYATGNVPSNQTPLTVEDLAQDKKGLQVNAHGEVIEYNNHIHESVEVKEYSALDMDVSAVKPAFGFISGGPGLGLDEEDGETCPSCGSPVEDCECEGHEHEVEEEICEGCGSTLVEGECLECGMYESIDEDLHEAFKSQREQILENFNRFKKFN